MTDAASTPRELPLLIGRGRDEAETLLLIGVPAGGRVSVRRWSGAQWGDAPAPSTEDALALLAWIETQAAAGRSLTQSLYAVRLWLTGLGDRIP